MEEYSGFENYYETNTRFDPNWWTRIENDNQIGEGEKDTGEMKIKNNKRENGKEREREKGRVKEREKKNTKTPLTATTNKKKLPVLQSHCRNKT